MRTLLDRAAPTPGSGGASAPLPAPTAGRLRLRPGQRPAIVREAWSDLPSLLAVGRPAAELPARMAALHALCASGHRLAATLALQAALGMARPAEAGEGAALRLAVAREQLLRIAHDWPRLLPGAHRRPAGAVPAFAGCPLWDPALDAAAQLQALSPWLARHWLGVGPRLWLAARGAADGPIGAKAVLAWARRRETGLAALLAEVLPAALALATPARPWRATRPLTLEAAPPDTGPWTRRRAAQAGGVDNAGMRLIARFIDLLQLAEDTDAGWLATDSATLAPGVGAAWVEVGRGLLSYRVALEDRPDGPRVQSLQVLTPTDWNVHPAGTLAEALAGLQDGDAAEVADAAAVLAVAFDPCLPFEVQARPEAAHA